jgi:hypothetical protein
LILDVYKQPIEAHKNKKGKNVGLRGQTLVSDGVNLYALESSVFFALINCLVSPNRFIGKLNLSSILPY